MTPRISIYCRVSRDRVGAGLGVERQERDCRELARKSGWRVIDVHTDNDISAYSGKPRPGYRQLLEQVRSGAVDSVVCWHTDRLHRSPVELETWIDAAQVHDVKVHTCKAGPLDLATPSGRMVARQLGAVARYEVEHRSERVKAQKLDAAASGLWRGGRRPFGYERDGRTVRPSEAAVVEGCTDRVLAGESLHSIAGDLNDRGIKTSTGRAWKGPELRGMILRARNAGLIERHGAIVGPAEWSGIVDPGKWRLVRDLLTTPGRKHPISADRVWLGAGLFLCGVCGDGTTMISASTRNKARGGAYVPAYACRSGAHLTRTASYLDEFVTGIVIERLSRPDAQLLLAPAARRVDVEGLHVQREVLRSRARELAALFARGAMTGDQLETASEIIRADTEGIDRELAAATATSPLSGFADAEDVETAWKSATVGRRKAVVRALMDVTLLPAPKGRPAGWSPGEPYFNPDAVRISWKTK